nr:putative Gag-polypeptide of LTR copia-type [Tanacetum cinerariifolium]
MCNSVVLGWLLGSISKVLYLGQIFSKIPSKVWDELKETYDKVNGSVIFDLHHQINMLSQNGSTLSDYYHKLNSLWKQSDALVKLPACTCDAAKGFKKHNDLIKLMQFLMSGLTGHTVDKCYKIIGYPDHIKKKWANQKTSSNNASVEVPTFTTTTSRCSAPSLSAGQIHQLLNLLKSSKSSNNAHIYMRVHKLERDSKLFIGFDEHKCYIQDLQVQKTLRIGSQREATHDEDDTESLDSDSRATQEDHILLYQIDNTLWNQVPLLRTTVTTSKML